MKSIPIPPYHDNCTTMWTQAWSTELEQNCFNLTVWTYCKHVDSGMPLCNITVNLEILRQLPGVSLLVALSELIYYIPEEKRCQDTVHVQVYLYRFGHPSGTTFHYTTCQLQRADLWPLQCFYSLHCLYIVLTLFLFERDDCHKRGKESYQECIFCAYKWIIETNVCSINQDAFKTYNSTHAICKLTS